MSLTRAYIYILLSLPLAACHDDEMPDQGSAISFASALSADQQVTRTDYSGLESLHTSFCVFGYKNMAGGELQTVFPGYQVQWCANTAGSANSNSADWEYVGYTLPGQPGIEQSIKYWDVAASDYRFVAYAPSSTTKASYAGGVLTLTGLDATQPDAVLFSHLCHATSAQYQLAVQLQFARPFAKVRYYFVFDDAIPDDSRNSTCISGYDNYPYMDASTINAANAPTFVSVDASDKIATEGSLTVSYALTGTESETYGSVPANEVSLAASVATTASASSRPFTALLPTPAGQHDYLLTVEIDNQQRTAIVPAAYMTWLPGYAYTYIFKITESNNVVLFDTQIEDWHYGGEQDEEEWTNW